MVPVFARHGEKKNRNTARIKFLVTKLGIDEFRRLVMEERAILPYDPAWTAEVLDGFKMRAQPGRWKPGRFVHPHDACFDRDGNIFVVEWVPTGRVTKLRKLS